MSTGMKKPAEDVSLESMMRELGEKFDKAMARSYSINMDHDVPYVAGYSKDGRTYYIDRHLPKMFRSRSVLPFLLEHERSEKCALDSSNWKYPKAHQLATAREKRMVETYGYWSWADYQNFYKPYIKGIEKEDLTKLPLDLDLEPYEDEHDTALLKRMIDAQARERAAGVK